MDKARQAAKTKKNFKEAINEMIQLNAAKKITKQNAFDIQITSIDQLK